MTFRQMAELIDSEDKMDSVGFLQVAFQILRSAVQNEPATFEGCCASILKWIEFYGTPTKDSVEKWLDDTPTIADLDIPDSMWDFAWSAEESDERADKEIMK